MKEKKRLIIAVVLVILLGILVLAIVSSNKSSSFKVTFDSHGGTEIESQSIKKGELIEIPTDPEKEGYEFIGWYYDGKKFDFSKELEKNIKLEAKWLKVDTIKIVVSFDSTGGSRIEDQKIKSGEKAKKPENPVRTGYTFVGWTLNGKTYDFNSKVKEDIKLVAVWKKDEVAVVETPKKPVSKPVVKPIVTKKVYTVTFYSDNQKISSVEVEEGKTVKEPGALTKENYVFKGWQYQSNYYDFSKPVTSNMKIEAIWTPILDSAIVASDDLLTNNGRNTANQKSVALKRERNQITITRNAPLVSFNSVTGAPSSEWVALLLDLGEKPESVEATSDIVTLAEGKANPEIAILDSDLTDDDTTSFVVWIDASAETYKDGQSLTFKNIDEEVIGTVTVVVDYKKMNLQSVSVDPSSKVEITRNGNVISVMELPGLTSTTYKLVFDLGIDPSAITVQNGTITNIVANSTSFVVEVENAKSTITFTSAIDSADELVVTLEYIPVVETDVYEPNKTIQIEARLSEYVVYDANTGTFTVSANVDGFTFDDDGTSMTAVKGANGWTFGPTKK